MNFEGFIDILIKLSSYVNEEKKQYIEERIKLFKGVKGINMTHEYEMHDADLKYIKMDDNPDLPDPYEVANATVDHLYGRPTSGWL